jgi:hypothetical protein
MKERSWRIRSSSTGNWHSGNRENQSTLYRSSNFSCNKPVTNAVIPAEKKTALDRSSFSTQSYPLPSYSNLISSDTIAGELYRRICVIVTDITPLNHSNIQDIPLIEYPYTIYKSRNARSTLFWQFWRLICPYIKDVEIYYLSLRHGVSVAHCVRTHEMKLALPHRCICDSQPPYIRNPLFQEFNFVDQVNDAYNQTYIREVTSLLTRENARGFLERGGLAWRIAIEFGPSTLWKDTFSGPSLSVGRFFEGDFWPNPDWICEAPLSREINVLIGGVYDLHNGNMVRVVRSLFPPLDLFENSAHWNGFWTSENETWFGHLIGKLRRGALRARTRHEWDRWDRSNRMSLTENIAQSYLSELGISSQPGEG